MEQSTSGSPTLVAADRANGSPSRRILMVAPWRPSPPSWGAAIRTYHLARELARRHRLTLLTFHPDGSSAGEGLAGIFESVHAVPPPTALRHRRRAQLRSVVSTASYHIASHRSAALQTELDRLTAEHRFDVVQVELSLMSGFDLDAGPVLVLDEHNVEHELVRRLAGVGAGLGRRLFAHLEQRKVRREEIGAWTRFDGCVFTSAVDEAIMRRSVPATPSCVVPNAVDLDRFRPVSTPTEDGRVAFVGTLNYQPNTDAVAHFVHDILPHLRRVRPSTAFSVVGQLPPPALTRLGGRHVEFTGAVDDVRPHLARARVIAVPLRIGSGTRLKVLEGLAMGKAMVTTTIGCEGIDVRDGEHLLVADDPEHFAEQVERLMEDAELRERLGRAGRALVEANYGWPAAARRLEAFHDVLTAGRMERRP
jgi:glycosyltransferase involved in cell wall biosynthesis